jgi:hypothetical protein
VVIAVVVVARRDGADLRVVEIGFSQVVDIPPVPDGSNVDEGERAVSWAAIVENGGDRLARNVRVDVTLLDDSGEVVDETAQFVDVLLPDRRTAITGSSDERPSDVADVQVELAEPESWEETGQSPGITVDDLEVAYGHANQPLVTFTATSRFDTPIRERTVHAVGRDRDGGIVAGWTNGSLPDEPRLVRGEPVEASAFAPFTVPNLATVEVYVEPEDGVP